MKKIISSCLIIALFIIVLCNIENNKHNITLFVSGLGDDKLDRWQKMKTFMQEKSMIYGGEISPTTALIDIKNNNVDFFFAKTVDTQSSISNQVSDLAQIINKLKIRLGEKTQINLVGYSLGGVIARSYVVTESDPNIIRLISIASPHLGSNWAYFWDLKTHFDHHCLIDTSTKNQLANDIHDMVCNAAIFSKIESHLKLKITSDALRDIRPYTQDEPDKFLLHLNQAKHPDIEYHSITASVEPVKNIEELITAIKESSQAVRSGKKLSHQSAKLITFLRQVASFPMVFINSDVKKWTDGGDGAVHHQSQQIANIDYFNQRQSFIEKTENPTLYEHEVITLIDHHKKIHNYTFHKEFHYGTLENESILDLITTIVND